MKKGILVIIFLQLWFGLFAQKPLAKIELRRASVNMTVGWLCFAGATYCTWNAFEAHQKYVFNYNRGYSTDIADYQKIFKNQMYFSVGFATAGIILQGCALYHFTKYREAMDYKITFKATPTGVGIAYSIR